MNDVNPEKTKAEIEEYRKKNEAAIVTNQLKKVLFMCRDTNVIRLMRSRSLHARSNEKGKKGKSNARRQNSSLRCD